MLNWASWVKCRQMKRSWRKLAEVAGRTLKYKDQWIRSSLSMVKFVNFDEVHKSVIMNNLSKVEIPGFFDFKNHSELVYLSSELSGRNQPVL